MLGEVAAEIKTDLGGIMGEQGFLAIEFNLAGATDRVVECRPSNDLEQVAFAEGEPIRACESACQNVCTGMVGHHVVDDYPVQLYRKRR